MKKKFLGTARKLRTISFDTNMIIDLLSLKYLLSKQKLTKEDEEYVERCQTSLQVLSLVLSVNVKTIGTDVVRDELSFQPELKNLYLKTFENTVEVTAEEKKLANVYVSRIGIKPPDALILALVSRKNIDCFLSWNRADIVRPQTLSVLSEINEQRKLNRPLILTPSEFLERITLSDRRTICFFPDVVPQQYRPRFYPSKQLL